MQKIFTETDLKEAILHLETKNNYEGKMLRAELHLAHESLKPINLIKNTFREVAGSPELKNNIINTSLGLLAGYISEKVFVNRSHNPAKKLLGTALMFGITNMIAKNPNAVRSFGLGLIKIIRSKLAARAQRNIVIIE